MLPAVSVVVPTCKRRDLLARCLEALLAQDYDRSRYEIIVADDEASQKTCHLVSAFACRVSALGLRVRYVAVKETRGPAAARNRGWRTACGEIIAFTDDDCIPAPGWLSAGVAAFSDGTDGVAGRVTMPLPEKPSDYERNASGLQTSEFVTANCFYRTRTLERVGGFDEQFREAWREDSDLFFTLIEDGSRLVFCQEAAVLHPIRPASWGISLTQQRKSMYNALLYKKHPELYKRRLPNPFCWSYYAGVLTLLAGLGGAAQHNTVLAAAGTLGWALLTAEFCARRLRHTSRRPAHVAEMVVTSALIPPLSVYWRLRGALRFRVLFL